MNANYIYNVEYSDEAAEVFDREKTLSANQKKGMSERNADYLRRMKKAINQALMQRENRTKERKNCFDSHLKIEHIRMKTCYPGALIGTGSAHETGALNELILGFTLDYVTGIPYLPASSLKGLLRSAFHFGDKKQTEYIQELLEHNDIKDSDEKFVQALEKALFVDPAGKTIFFDSFIEGFTEKAGKYDSYVGMDYITPHKDGPLKNPVPLPMLRINPNVVFDFAFHLEDITVTVEANDYVIKADVIKNLFITILKDFGIGAKTNVGYGVLEEYNGNASKHFIDNLKQNTSNTLNNSNKNASNVHNHDNNSRSFLNKDGSLKTGYIKKWNADRRFGFLDEDENQRQGKYYFNARSLEGIDETELNENCHNLKVKFIPAKRDDGNEYAKKVFPFK